MQSKSQACVATPKVWLPPLKAIKLDLKKMSPNIIISMPAGTACTPAKQSGARLANIRLE